MANPAPVEPEAPRPWYAGLIGGIVVALLLGAVALSTAASYNGDDDHGDDTEHSEDGEHSEEEGDHSEDE